jgi:hypothetical protein
MEFMNIPSKICKKCSKTLSFDHFHKDNKASDKLKSRCKDCANSENKYFYNKDKDIRLKKIKEKNELFKMHKIIFVFKNIDHLKQLFNEKIIELQGNNGV